MTATSVERARVIGALGVMLLGLATALVAAGCGADGRGREDSAVHVVQLAPPAMLAALEAGEIDGFIAWEPFPAMAEAAGTGSYLVRSGDDWPDHPCCVVAVRSGGVSPEVTEALLWAHVTAGRFAADPAHAAEVAAYAAEFTGAAPEVVQSALSDLAFRETFRPADLERFLADMRDQDLVRLSAGDETAFWGRFLDPGPLERVRSELEADPAWVPSPVVPDAPLRLGYISKDLHQLAVFIAQKEGYLDRVGLRVGVTLELKPYPNGVAIMQAFQSGEVDAAYLGAAPAVLKSANDGIDVSVLAGANVEGTALVVRRGSDIATVEDLAGGTVAVPQVGTVQYVLLKDVLARHGMVGLLE